MQRALVTPTHVEVVALVDLFLLQQMAIAVTVTVLILDMIVNTVTVKQWCFVKDEV